MKIYIFNDHLGEQCLVVKHFYNHKKVAKLSSISTGVDSISCNFSTFYIDLVTVWSYGSGDPDIFLRLSFFTHFSFCQVAQLFQSSPSFCPHSWGLPFYFQHLKYLEQSVSKTFIFTSFFYEHCITMGLLSGCIDFFGMCVFKNHSSCKYLASDIDLNIASYVRCFSFRQEYSLSNFNAPLMAQCFCIYKSQYNIRNTSLWLVDYMYAGHFLTKAINRIEKFAFKEYFWKREVFILYCNWNMSPVKKPLPEDKFISVWILGIYDTVSAELDKMNK